RTHAHSAPPPYSVCPPRTPIHPLEHPGGAIKPDNLVPVLGDRHRDPSRTATELEDRPAGAAREAAEPLDVGADLGWRGREVVERRESRRFRGVALGAQPVTRRGRRAPPSRV